MTLAHLLPPVMLVLSNLFMTLAWYGHLKFTDRPLLLVIVVSWGIALVEYMLAVPANRIGSRVYTAAELKTFQEVISLTVFMGFSLVYLHQPVTMNTVVGFGLMLAGAVVVFRGPF